MLMCFVTVLEHLLSEIDILKCDLLFYRLVGRLVIVSAILHLRNSLFCFVIKIIRIYYVNQMGAKSWVKPKRRNLEQMEVHL